MFLIYGLLINKLLPTLKKML